jgi:hypothetical protein
VTRYSEVITNTRGLDRDSSVSDGVPTIWTEELAIGQQIIAGNRGVRRFATCSRDSTLLRCLSVMRRSAVLRALFLIQRSGVLVGLRLCGEPFIVYATNSGTTPAGIPEDASDSDSLLQGK